MRKFAWLIGLACLIVAGCDKGSETSKPPEPEQKVAKELVLTGPGGSVQIGDSIEQAKKAFPVPDGAQEKDSTATFIFLTPTGWSWAVEQLNPQGFEAATKDGKIVAMGRTSAADDDMPTKTIADLGEPKVKEESKTGTVYYWDAGDKARFIVQMKKMIDIIPFKTMVVIGNKEDLDKMGYLSSNPGAILEQLDMAITQYNTPEVRKAFEDAKKKALEKMKKKGA